MGRWKLGRPAVGTGQDSRCPAKHDSQWLYDSENLMSPVASLRVEEDPPTVFGAPGGARRGQETVLDRWSE